MRSNDELFGASDNSAKSLQSNCCRSEQRSQHEGNCLLFMCRQINTYGSRMYRHFMHCKRTCTALSTVMTFILHNTAACTSVPTSNKCSLVLTPLSGVFHLLPEGCGANPQMSAEECFKWATCIFWTDVIHYSSSRLSCSAAVLLGIYWEILR